MQRYLNYLKSIFSLKKIFYRDVSVFSFWDKDSSFTKYSRIGPFVRLLNSSIGKYTRISKGCSLVYCEVGKFCSLSSKIQVGAGRHPLNYLSSNQIFYNKNTLSNKWVKSIQYEQNLPVTIGNDVWIGTDCLIMGGVKIGDGAVIGAKALVTKDIPPYAIVGGVPAKIIKYRFSPEIIEKLLEIKWWDFSDEKISENIEIFRKPDISLEDLNAIRI
ncbi:CatB-related O-acetyltransferase [Robiginitalea aurantiaca]|uniref:CatB-related O-acetyltransferase n=1 Tax=Robiginitalea aurantiaca TaxID=3056915 RepID=A0ABT7WIR6_9FLAO|nr:CatB-related O-acetyltransferase [Robiginitalea aurantiaca]MDM9632796.1 CatB-related O-acetyltransferase [Robiginitalea aurantiaca]